MINERAFLQEVGRQAPDELKQTVLNADTEQARALRIYLGPDQFSAIQRMAAQQSTRGAAPKKGNVVVLHGLAGGELTLFNNGSQDLIWVNILHLIEGQFDRLPLQAEGTSVRDVRASGIYLRFYGSQIVSLSADWNVKPFFYDWRRDIREAAKDLARLVDSFGADAPVNLVAHSMGGLVARTFIAQNPDRWAKGGKLIMLGVPNYGSFAVPRLLFGTNDLLSLLNKIDVAHDTHALLEIAKTFEGVCQLMPVRNHDASTGDLDLLYKASTYTFTSVDQALLDRIAGFQSMLTDEIDPARMVYIAGYNRMTLAGIKDPTQLASDAGYKFTKLGDGTVPHVLGLLKGVPTFFVDEEHIKLPAHPAVQQAVLDLLDTGTTNKLADRLPDAFAEQRGGGEQQAMLQSAESARRGLKETQAVALRQALQAHSDVTGQAVSPEEQALTDLLLTHDPLPITISGTTGFTAETRAETAAAPADQVSASSVASSSAKKAPGAVTINPSPSRLRVHVVSKFIHQLQARDVPDEPRPVDCIAVGHYLHVQPTGAEHDIDLTISPFYFKKREAESSDDPEDREDLIIRRFHERGILRGDLGVPFYIPDPRPGFEGALLVFAGMGPTGQFGVPELSVLSRELVWSMSLLGRKHLATVLIGASKRNLSIAECVQGWALGVSRTLAGLVNNGIEPIEAITFVVADERDPEALPLLIPALKKMQTMLRDPNYNVEIDLKLPPESEKLAAARPTESRFEEAVRISIEFSQDGFLRYSALTNSASIPERAYHINPKRIKDVNARLLSVDDPGERYRLGRFLLDFLMPPDLRARLTGSAPVVLACNNEAAKVYWELAAQPLEDEPFDAARDAPFLGLTRGLTRQLRTVLAPPPEPPPPAGRVLRILLVANGCKERPLKGADQEARQLLDLFNAFNEQAGKSGNANRVAVTPLIGPSKATTLDILLNINDQPPYDVLHYAGHCEFDKDNPINSGLLFSDGDRLTAEDLNRVDRTPKFVFANACESGVMPSRPDLSTSELPAAFAEAFFKKGVTNFICTAWSISDSASRDFAMELYTQLLGFDGGDPKLMYEAMREARQKISTTHTWGAYQHYGSPYFRLLRAHSSRSG